MAYNRKKGYDPDLDYSRALEDSTITGDERTRLETERIAKINDMYGGYEPMYGDTGMTYTQYKGGTKGVPNYDLNTDYHAKAADLAGKGNWTEAYGALFAPDYSREAKIAGTGDNYGKTSQQIWQELQQQYGGDPFSQQSMITRLYSSIPQYQDIPKYGGSWGDDEYRRLLEQAIGMNYSDWTKGEDYAALQDRYSRQGMQAMQDTLAQLSARTGGLASSYAGTAAQERYNDYMTLLEQAARAQYASDRGDIIQNAGLAQQYGQQDYNRWMDEVALRRQGLNDVNAIVSELAGYAAQADKDAYAQRQDAQNFIYSWLLSGHDISGIPADMITASGLTTDILNSWAREGQKALQSQSGGSGRGGSSGSNGGGATSTEDAMNALFEAAYNSGIDPNVYISNNYKSFGLTGVGDLRKAYADWVEGMPQRNFDAQAAALGEITGGWPASNRYTPEEVAAADTAGMDTMNMAYLFFNDNFAGQRQFTSTMEKAAENWAREHGLSGDARSGEVREFIDYIRYWIEEG